MSYDESATPTGAPPRVLEQADGQQQHISETQSGIRSWFRWGCASLVQLAQAESRLLAHITTKMISRFVPVRLASGQIYTLTLPNETNTAANKIPVVMVHGFGAGCAIWARNLEPISKKRTVHAMDILGFGRSSRPQFSDDPTIAELEFVQSIEDWRKAMEIEKMILVGHSFGAFLVSSYALEHPHRVRHLVLCDPWGFAERPTDAEKQTPLPTWFRSVIRVMSHFSIPPLKTLRLVGPYGPALVKKLRPDLGRRYASEHPDAIYDYIYHCNAQVPPTGEEAFAHMTQAFGWAKRPMIHRFSLIEPSVPVTFVCGSKSWLDNGPAFDICEARSESYVNVQIIRGAGHHVYADAPQEFNNALLQVSDLVDSDRDSRPTSDHVLDSDSGTADESHV